MSVTAITSKEQFDKLLGSGKVIFIDFWATWCGPCRMISPAFEKLAEENTNPDAEFYKVDVDDVPQVAQEAGIKAMPTFHVYKNREKLGEMVGAHPSNLTNLIKNNT